MKKIIIATGLILIGFSVRVNAQINLKGKSDKILKLEKNTKIEARDESTSRATKTYVTGTSAGDNKLKAFDKKMNELESQLALYETFLSSNVKYNNKQNSITFLGDGASLKVVNKFIENNFDTPLVEIKNGKKYAPDYSFEQEENRYQEFINKYNSLKENSHQQALKYKQSRADDEYLNSDDYATTQYVKSELFKEKLEDPIYSDMHKNNKGKIVFNNVLVDKINPKGSFNGVFNASGRLYARAFLDRSFTNITMYNSKKDSIRYGENSVAFPYILIYIDGKKQDYMYDNVSISGNNQLKNNTRQIWMYPNVSDGLTNINWIKSVDKLPVGNHKVKLEYFIYEPTENDEFVAKIAEGEFTLVKKAGDKLKIGKSWNDFKTAMSNSSLETKILNVAKSTSKLDDGLQPKEVKIMNSDWKVVSNKLTGVILYRLLVVQIKCTNVSGYCYTIPREAKQEYLGGGNYSTEITLITHTNKHIGFDGYIDCN